MSSLERIVLGTAQFGLNYGLHEHQIQADECHQILASAFSQGVCKLDTAVGYGAAENLIGAFHSQQPDQVFKCFTKLAQAKPGQIRAELLGSLKRLNLPYLDGCFFHSFSAFSAQPAVWEELLACQSEGLVKSIGFSLYHPHEWDWLKQHQYIPDLLQIPYNLLDRRFEALFSDFVSQQIQTYVRSVFLQGVLLDAPLPKELAKGFQAPREQLDRYCRSQNITKVTACLGFVLKQVEVNGVLIGIDSLQHFQDNLTALQKIPENQSYPLLSVDDERLLLPYLWPQLT